MPVKISFLLVSFFLLTHAHAGDEFPALRLEKALSLTPQQVEQVKTIRKKFRPEIRPLKMQMLSLKKDLLEKLQSPKKGSDYQKELTAKFGELQTVKQGLAQKRFQMALEIREILNDDQISKFKELGGSLRRGRHYDESQSVPEFENEQGSKR